MAFASGVHQRGAADALLQVSIRAALKQQLDHPLVAVEGGAHQRGATSAALQVDLRAVLQQQLDQPLVAVAGGRHQRSDATHSAFPASRVDPPAAAEPRQQRRLVALRSRLPGLFGKAAGLLGYAPWHFTWRFLRLRSRG